MTSRPENSARPPPDVGKTGFVTLGLWLSALLVFGLSDLVMGGAWARAVPLWLVGIAVTGVTLSLLLARVINALDRAPRLVGWPVLVIAVGSVAFAQSLLDFAILQWARQITGDPFSGRARFVIGFNLLVYLWLFGLYATAVKLQHANTRARRHEKQLLEARAAGDRARLDALRYQVNPHFLFNTLNGLQTLIAADRKSDALAMVQRLSAFLRSSLESEAGDLTPLAAELDALEAYLEIEHARFGDRLEIAIDCPEALRGAQVPHLILQPLVENVMTHVVARVSTTVRIDIGCRAEAGELIIDVVDSGGPRAATADGLGLGLANVRSRLELHFGERGVLACGPAGEGFRARIRQPLLSGNP